jgi:hypothetical protein
MCKSFIGNPSESKTHLRAETGLDWEVVVALFAFTCGPAADC